MVKRWEMAYLNLRREREGYRENTTKVGPSTMSSAVLTASGRLDPTWCEQGFWSESAVHSLYSEYCTRVSSCTPPKVICPTLYILNPSISGRSKCVLRFFRQIRAQMCLRQSRMTVLQLSSGKYFNCSTVLLVGLALQYITLLVGKCSSKRVHANVTVILGC